MSDMSDTSGVPDPCLKSGVFLSGSDLIVWNLSGHSLFRPHQATARYTADILQVQPSPFSRPQITTDITIRNVSLGHSYI